MFEPVTTKTTCPYCGVGCGVDATSSGGYSVEVSGDESHPANHGRLCVKGSALGETVDLEGRLMFPQVRGQAVPWDMALDTVARGFKRAIEQHGPDRVAFYVSGQLLTEDYYVANKLMKGYIGSANIDTNSRLCMSSAVAGHKRAFGNDIVPGCYDDLEQADLIVLVGSNTAWCHPVLFQRMIKSAEGNPNKRIVVLDPRRTATCEQADLHLPLKPGTDTLLFNGLLAYLAEHNLVDDEYVSQHTEGFDAAIATARQSAGDLDKLAKDCGLEREALLTFFRWFGETSKTVTVFSQGVNQSSAGTDKVNSIINTHLATGRVGKPGASPFSITGQPNAMGGREVGGLANMLAAHMGFDQAPLVQEFWNSPTISKHAGFKAVELFDAMRDGYIKAVWIMATNPAVSLPAAGKVREALEKCEFVAVSDCVANTDTAKYADVLLPASGWGEKNGTVTNSERRISRQRQIMPAAGDARPDWQIICEVAKRMGYGAGFPYTHPQEIFSEHAALSGFRNDGQRDFDISAFEHLNREAYDALHPIQWPIRETGDLNYSGTSRMLGDGKFFTPSGKGQFISIQPRRPENRISDDYPLVLNSGRVRDHWHTMTRTGKSQRLSQHRFETFVAVHPADAEKFELKDDQLATLSSRWGLATARVVVTESQRPGDIFMPIHWTDQFTGDGIVGKVVNPVVDPISGEPEFKHTPVKIEPFASKWFGFALTRRELDVSGQDYWAKAKGEHFWRYEMSGSSELGTAVRLENEVDAISMVQAESGHSQWAKSLLSVPDGSPDWIDFLDEGAGLYRAVWLSSVGDSDHIEACLFIAKTPEALPDRGWLASLFTSEEIGLDERTSLLLGESPDPEADVGAIVCACFGVGQKSIERAIVQDGCDSAAALGNKLKCGTNCGSCVPELNNLVATLAMPKAA